ncbi:MAG TPA: hypothetical protein VMS62_08565 [Gemmatimonadales bacterium]|nr:hypothetical protein [Gemmatimonadales bacterium]
MRSQRLLFALTALNLVLLLFILVSSTVPALASTSVSPVLRGRALEIVDDRGRVRASIKLHPAHTFEPTGKRYPETVMLRLIDPNGRPEIKIGASVEGGGLSLVGISDSTQVLLLADSSTSVRLKNRTGQERVIRP